MQTRTVPMREYRVNGSPRIKVANMVLKTRPDYIFESQRGPKESGEEILTA